ncbi:MAG: SDR family oxidoreductase [Akkermansiaceae bacterium]|nr:SDR family oxidoreductase [Akkermansiaceae bacterium]
MTSLQGKTLLVTGASSGIGQALCGALVERGANVLGVTRRSSVLSEDISPILADLSKPEQVAAIFDGLGKIDGLINCAGVAYLSRIIDGDPREWQEMWSVNVMALTLCCQLSLKHFPATGGRIINVSSMSGHRVPPSGGFYAPTKIRSESHYRFIARRAKSRRISRSGCLRFTWICRYAIARLIFPRTGANLGPNQSRNPNAPA